jgi:DNA topoisomerase-1
LGRGDENGAAEQRVLGVDPKSSEEVSLKSGRFGPYVQLGTGEKPQRASIPKGFTAETMDLEKALRLLSLPREVGHHPETGKPIMAGFGRFGPYISHDGAYASLETPEDVFTVGINRAVTLLAERKEKGGRGGRGGQALKELGAHPASGAPIKVMKGRYGPYVTDGSVNATLPRDSDPASVTLEEAVALIAARAEKVPRKRNAVGRRDPPTAKRSRPLPKNPPHPKKQKHPPPKLLPKPLQPNRPPRNRSAPRSRTPDLPVKG